MNINHESHAISRRSFLKASGVVGAAGILAACGGSSSSSTAASSGATSAPNTTGAAPLKEFISWEATNRELESWNMLYTQMASDMNVTTNLWEGLLSFDCYGKAVPSVAKEWSHNEDSSVWTFNLRDDVDWVDVNGEVKAHLTSKDFLVGLEWVLNAAKNQANNTSMPNETLVGAADYYQKTSDMGDAAADLTYEDMLAAGVGVEAPDDYTLVFTCKAPCPYFDTVAAYTSFYPASQALIDELGIERPDHIEYLYPVLHSFTGAAAVRREFPELDDGIISAIHNHTLGSLDMSDLDIIIFVADMIEPLRKSKGRPEVKRLRQMAGKVPLDELYFEAYAATMRSLIDRKRFIDPAALDIWNGLVKRHHPIDKSRQGNPDAVL